MTVDERAEGFDADWDPDAWGTGAESDIGPAEPAGPSGTDDRIHEGFDHLQRAAREMIAASRALLDVAEELIEDPGSIGRIARMVAGAPRPVHRSGPDRGPDDDDDPPVQRIPIT